MNYKNKQPFLIRNVIGGFWQILWQVFLEFVAVKNIPEGQKGDLCVLFSKSQPDAFFNAKRGLSILSETGKKQVASFQCEPTGELHFELLTCTSSNLAVSKSSKTLGSASLSLEDYLDPVSKLSVQKWLELVPGSGTTNSKPILLQVAISFTVPTLAPFTLEMVQSPPISSSFVMPQHAMAWTHVMDEIGIKIISLQMRYSTQCTLCKIRNTLPKVWTVNIYFLWSCWKMVSLVSANVCNLHYRDLKTAQGSSVPGKEVIGLVKSGETFVLAKFVDNGWSLIDNLWSLRFPNECRDDGHLFELKGTRTVSNSLLIQLHNLSLALLLARNLKMEV